MMENVYERAHKVIMMNTCQNDFLKDWILEILHENNCNMIGDEYEFNRFINQQTKFETEEDMDEILIVGYEKELIDGCLT
tara:strand:+ start:192 stop:431 length:240 start_codon:yes stop_codon:yes gene_type:complete